MKKNNISNTIVCFDIDRTIISGQSQQFFLRYLYNKKEVSFVYYVTILLWFGLYKLNVVNDPERVMNYAYGMIAGKNYFEVQEITTDFFKTVLSAYFFADVVARIKKYQKEGYRIVLISNSTDIIVEQIANFFDIPDFIATTLKRVDDVYTGTIVPPIIYGAQKCTALDVFLKKEGYSDAYIVVYTDHISDLPLLERADEPHVVNPHKPLKRVAEARGWDIIKAV